MGFPIFSFLLSNEIEGDYPISEPGGWDEAIIKLERNEKYHSLVEFYEQPLTFYGSDGVHDGGLDYIRNIEETQGVDADISITISVNFGQGDEILFKGLLDLAELKEIDGYKADIPILREDVWSKFINRSSTPVDIQLTTSLDGSDVHVITPLDLTLTSQKLIKRYNANSDQDTSIVYDYDDGWNVSGYLQVDFPNNILSEVTTKFNIPNSYSPSLPVNLFSMDDAGVYDFDLRIEGIAQSNLAYEYAGDYVDWYIRVNNSAPIVFSKTNYIDGIVKSTVYTYSGSLSLSISDEVRIYGDITADISGIGFGDNPQYLIYSPSTSLPPSGSSNPSYFSISAATVFKETQADTMLIHDLAESIVQRTSEISIHSNYMGGSLVHGSENYSVDGCAYPFAAMKGLHIRQYSFTDKPFSISFNDFWDGVDPIFCLGLGYEELSPKVQFLNRYFDVSISQWEQFASSGTLQAFSYQTGGFALADGSISGLPNTARIGQSQYSKWPAGTYRVKIKAYNNSTGGLSPLASGLAIWASNTAIGDGSSTSISYTGDGTWNVGDNDTRFYDFTLAQNWDYVAFAWNKQGPGGGYECYIQIDLIEVVQYRIRIEQRDHFYDKSSNSVNLSFVDNIERSYATDKIYKKVDIGYQKWESENISGVDDPQTKHTYSAGFRKVGEELELYSKFIAASYAIESTRRQVIEKSKDYKLDNDTFIIAISPNASPIVPESDEYFTSVTNLNNSDTRYNLRITPYWNFTNWVQWFSGSFTTLTSANWTFQEGEGNFDVGYSTSGGCLVNFPSDNHAENSDVSVSNLDIVGSTFKLKVIDFEHPLSWSDYKTIRENRNKSIGVSESNTDHESYFILSLEYQITKGKAKFKLLQAGDLNVPITFDSTVSTFDSTVLTFDME
jgi:hypothetical protein